MRDIASAAGLVNDLGTKRDQGRLRKARITHDS